MKTLTPQHKTLLARLLCLVMLAAAMAILLLPMSESTYTAVTKTATNTAVGDEKYYTTLAQVEESAAAYEGARIVEKVTESVSTKGVKTSKVTFEVQVPRTLSGYDLMTMGFGCSWVLLGVLALMIAAEGALLVSLLRSGQQETELRRLPRMSRILRTAAAWLCLGALVLAVIFPLCANLDFSRTPMRLTKVSAEELEASRELVEQYHELHPEHTDMAGKWTTWLRRLNNGLPGTYWLLPPVIFLALLGYVWLAKGELGPTLQRGALYLFVIVLCVVVLYPFFVMLITGFRGNQETTDMNFLNILPQQWHWENIQAIISRGVPQYLINSILLSVGATLIAMLCGIPAAYAMARMNFKGKKAFLGFVIMSQMFSPVVLLVGIAQLMDSLRLTDSIVGLMLINAAFNQAFAIWLLRGTFVSISSEMEQAACIDGCNSVSALIRILLPMAAPGIVTTLIFVFINAWNEYTISTVLISTNMNRPITVGITQFSSFNMIEWNYLFAASIIATIPVVILFMCIEKHLVSGLTSGGVKG